MAMIQLVYEGIFHDIILYLIPKENTLVLHNTSRYIFPIYIYVFKLINTILTVQPHFKIIWLSMLP